MKNESLFVAPMRHDFMKFGIRQIGLQLVLQNGLVFGSGILSEKSALPDSDAFSQIFLSRKKKRSAVSHAKWRWNISFRPAGSHNVQIANHGRQLVGQDKAVRVELPGKRKGVVESARNIADS